jgi:hypothetical protein
MNNYQSIIRNSSTIAHEVATTGNMVNPPRGFFPTKPKSQATIQRERAEMKRDSRKNQCTACHEALAMNGTCGNCD